MLKDIVKINDNGELYVDDQYFIKSQAKTGRDFYETMFAIATCKVRNVTIIHSKNVNHHA